MEIQAVFFDVGGTIDTHRYERDAGIAASSRIRTLLEQVGVSISLPDEQLYELIDRGQADYRRWREQTLVELSPERVWREFVLRDYPIRPEQLEASGEALAYTVDTCFYRRTLRPEIPAVLRELQRMGLKLGIISNIQSRGQVPGDLERYGIRSFFDPVVLSCEYGRRKPDPAIFRHAARLAGVPAAACVHIGDRVSRDILGARRAGFALALQIRHDYQETLEPPEPKPDAVLLSMETLPELILRMSGQSRSGTA